MSKSWFSGSLICSGCAKPITYSPTEQDFVHISSDAADHQAAIYNPGRPSTTVRPSKANAFPNKSNKGVK
jgi:hypothetical protein